jgi:hypothetical protein
MLSTLIEKSFKFVRSNNELLIILSLIFGLYGMYQNWSEKQVKWVDGWSCSYWDAERNTYQSLMDNIVRNGMNGQEFNFELWDSYKSERDSAAEKINEQCLPSSAYFME